MRSTALLLALLPAFCAFNAQAQDAEHEGELVYERNSYIPSAYLVKPGLSGLSQVYLRRDHNYKSKAFWDSQYVQHLGFWLDFKIFILSFLCLFGYEKGR